LDFVDENQSLFACSGLDVIEDIRSRLDNGTSENCFVPSEEEAVEFVPKGLDNMGDHRRLAATDDAGDECPLSRLAAEVLKQGVFKMPRNVHANSNQTSGFRQRIAYVSKTSKKRHVFLAAKRNIRSPSHQKLTTPRG
jgi:alkyl sulfatase BDS1-like metallo-beta-lactamase superfamily hydrolase